MSGGLPGPLKGLVLFPVLLFLLGILTFFFGFFLPFWMAGSGLLLALASLAGFTKGEPVRRRAIRAAVLLVLGPICVAGIFVPLRLVAVGVYRWIRPFANSGSLDEMFHVPFPPVAWLDPAIGVMAVLFTLYWALKNRARLLRVRDQIRNLPTSKTAAAATGLAEFKGVARRVDDPRRAGVQIKRGNDAGPGPEPDDARDCLLYDKIGTGDRNHFTKWSRFWIEDRSGRILVDPRGVKFWTGGSFLTIEAQSVLLARRRRVAPDAGPGVLQTVCLREGDRVYVIGAAEIDPEAPADVADSERLIVRPTKLYPSRGIMSRLVPGIAEEPAEDYKNTFFVFDRDENSAIRIMRKEERSVVHTALVWLALSLGLFWAGYYHPVAIRAAARTVALQEPHGYALINFKDGWINGVWPFSRIINGKSTEFGMGLRDSAASRREMADLVNAMYPRLVMIETAGGEEQPFLAMLEALGLRCVVVTRQDVQAYKGREPTWGSTLWTFAVDLDAQLGDLSLPPPRPYPPVAPPAGLH